MGALSPELAAPSIALRKMSLALLVDILRRGVAMGRFTETRLEVVAGAIGAMGMRIPYWYSPEAGLSVDELASAQADLALRMVGARA